MQQWVNIILLSIFSFLNIKLQGQIFNVDREVKADSAYQSLSFIAGMNLSSDKQKKSVFDVSSNIELNKIFTNRYLFIAAIKNDAVFNGNDVIQNEGLTHLRFRDQDSRRYSWEGYLQYQWNGAWGMEYRYVAGNNLRMKFLEQRKSDLYLGSGIFYEWEKWNWSGVKEPQQQLNRPIIQRTMFRLNQYLKYAIKLSDQVDFSAISYLQFPLKGSFLHPRWYTDANLFLGLGKKITFIVHWDHIFDSFRPVPIDKFYYSFSTGLQLNF
jgi:hypothetical protein